MKNPSSITIEDSMVLTFALVSLFLFPLPFFCFFKAKERFITEPSKENRWLMLKNLKLPNDFGGEVFIGKIWCEGSRVFDFLLIG